MKFVSTFVGSFYSQQMYRDLRTQRGLGLAYSFLLILTMLCVMCITYIPEMNRAHEALFIGENGRLSMMDDVLQQIANQTPEMVFEDNTLTTKVPGPHIIRLKSDAFGKMEEGDAITIDTTGATTYANMKTPILLTATDIVTKQKNKTEIKSYKELGTNKAAGRTIINADMAKDFAADASDFVKDNLSVFYLIMGSIILICVVVVLYVGRIITLLLLALAGMLIASVLKTELSFEDLMRFAAVSMTPVTVLATLSKITVNVAPGGVLLFGLGIIMLTVALYISRDEGVAA